MDFCESQIIHVLKEHPDGLRKGQIAKKINFSRKTTVKALYRLVRTGVVVGDKGTLYSADYVRNEKFRMRY